MGRDSAALIEGRELPAAGEMVSAIVLDSNVVIYLGANRQHALRIESPFKLRFGPAELEVIYGPYEAPAWTPSHLTELATLVAKRLLHASAYTNGELSLEFEADEVLNLVVDPNPVYEAWSYSYGGLLLHCPPGGDLHGATLRGEP